MVKNSQLDKNLVNMILEHYDKINEIRDTAQKGAAREFDAFQEKIDVGGRR
jgi:hypothetical protein